MHLHAFETPRSARFVTLGDLAERDDVWFLLHGYGQTAGAFLEDCLPLAAPGRLLVAPEALSRFYLRGGRGDVGASWMTREDREREIHDTLRYLDGLAVHLRVRRASVLGFSQGAAAAWRWAALGAAPLRRLVAWGAECPQDLDLAACAGRLAGLALVGVAGTDDPACPAEAQDRDRARLAAAGLAWTHHTFPGGHALDDELLRRVGGVPHDAAEGAAEGTAEGPWNGTEAPPDR